MRNYYETLEISELATEAQIKKQYKVLALRHHPDRNGGSKKSEEKFKEIQEAYTVLSNKESRKLYDTQFKNYKQSQKKNTESKNTNKQEQKRPKTDAEFEELLFDIMFERKRKTSDGEKIAAGILYLFKTFMNK